MSDLIFDCVWVDIIGLECPRRSHITDLVQLGFLPRRSVNRLATYEPGEEYDLTPVLGRATAVSRRG